MKVVLFCGGMGMRMRPLDGGGGAGEDLPKPMVHVGGQRPLIWHVMKYYAHYGHKDFILCLGYRAEVIKNYFLTYNEYTTNDFIMRGGKKDIELVHSDIADWNISFVDTGLSSQVGERLYAVREHLKDDRCSSRTTATASPTCRSTRTWRSSSRAARSPGLRACARRRAATWCGSTPLVA